jgi:hypothetical protein
MSGPDSFLQRPVLVVGLQRKGPGAARNGPGHEA